MDHETIYMVRMHGCAWKLGRWAGTKTNLRSRYITCYGPNLEMQVFHCPIGYSVRLESAMFFMLHEHRLFPRSELFDGAHGKKYEETINLITSDPDKYLDIVPKKVQCDLDTKHANNLIKLLCPQLRGPTKRLKFEMIDEVIKGLGLKSPFDVETEISDLVAIFNERLKTTAMFKDYNKTARLFYAASTGITGEWDLKKVIGAVNMVLNAAGLKLMSDTVRTMTKGVKTTKITYKMSADHVATMKELVVKLRLRGKSYEIPNEHACLAIAVCTLPKYGHLVHPKKDALHSYAFVKEE